MKFKQADFCEHLECQLEMALREHVFCFARKRVFYIFSHVPLRSDYLHDEVLGTLLGTLDGNLTDYHAVKLREKLHEKRDFLIDRGKQKCMGIGDVWERQVDLQRLQDIILDARKQADTLIILNVIHQRGLETLSLKDVLAFGAIPTWGDFTLRRANEVMTELENRGVIEKNGNLYRHGRDVLK